MEARLFQLAESQHGVFSRGQALELGLSRKEVEGRRLRGTLETIYPGAFRLAGSRRTFPQRVMAGVLAAGPGALASHRAAAALLDLPNVARRVEITVPAQRAVRLPDLVVHRSRLILPEDRGEVLGIPATSCGRTLLDLAGQPSYDKAKMGRLLASALVKGLVTRSEMEARLEGRRQGQKAALLMAELLAELPVGTRPMGSEFEADLLAALRDHGVALPVSQHRVRLPDGTEVFLDFAFPASKLALEADSFLWHATREAWRRDRRRNNELIALGWRILAITWDLVRFHPGELARLVLAALAGAEPGSGPCGSGRDRARSGHA